MQSKRHAEHEWLQKLVGEWSFESEATMEPGQPPAKFVGTESVRSIGDLWVIGEGRGEMPGGGTATMVTTIGYDPEKKQYVGTFIGSMMSNLWVYEGTLDPASRTLTMNTEGPNFGGDGKKTMYRDVTELKSDVHRVLTSSSLGDDGEWHAFMTANYWRTK